MGKLVQYKFFINNEEVLPPKNWQSIQILATFDQSSIQANISTTEFEFVNETAQVIRNYILGGLTLATNGIFEGLPFLIQATNDTNTLDIFEGYLDFRTYEEINPVTVKCSVKKTNSLNTLDLRSRANSFGYLYDQGFITPADFTPVPLIVQKVDNEADIALITLTISLLTIQLAQVSKELAKDASIVFGLLTAAPPISLGASGYYALASGILNAIFAGILIFQLVKLVEELARLLAPPVEYRAGMRLRRLLEIASDYLGYNFVSPIEELDFVVYLPSRQFEDGAVNGIPNQGDYGYQLSEIFELCNNMFNARLVVVGNDLHLRSLNDPYWVKNSVFQVPNVLDEKIKFNNADFVARTFVFFQTDLSDDWTVADFRGTNYEVITTPINGANSENNLMSGLNEVAIPLALGSRKTRFNEVEDVLFRVATVVDNIANFVGQNTNFANLIGGRIGALKISQKIHNLPKLLYLDPTTGKIPFNHRLGNLWTARALWDKYLNYNSFVSNDFGGQRRIYESKIVPFGFTDFLNTIENSYFVTENGLTGKVESIKWTLDSDTAEIDYWEQTVYTENLQEQFIEG